MIVYMIRNRVNGKAYIGQTVRKLRQRLSHHKCAAKRGSLSPVHSAIRKYGLGAFVIEVLASAKSLLRLNALEEHFISKCGTLSPDGYNVTKGRGNALRVTGWRHTEETKQIMSRKAIGRKFTKEHRQNLSISHRGKRQPCALSTRRKISSQKRQRDRICGPVATHVRWHLRRGLINSNCPLCRKDSMKPFRS